MTPSACASILLVCKTAEYWDYIKREAKTKEISWLGNTPTDIEHKYIRKVAHRTIPRESQKTMQKLSKKGEVVRKTHRGHRRGDGAQDTMTMDRKGGTFLSILKTRSLILTRHTAALSKGKRSHKHIHRQTTSSFCLSLFLRMVGTACKANWWHCFQHRSLNR